MNTDNQDDPQEIQPPEMVPSSREEQPLEPEPTAEEGHSETSPPPRLKRTWLFAAGFLGWFLVNGLLWLLISGGGDLRVDNSIFCVLPLNLVIIFSLHLVEEFRPIGQGILAAIGVNFVVSLFFNLFFNAFCLVPFFTE